MAISTGGVGKSGYVRFHTFRLVLTYQRTNGPMTKPLIELRIRN